MTNLALARDRLRFVLVAAAVLVAAGSLEPVRAQCELATIHPPDGYADQNFGFNLDIDGDVLAVMGHGPTTATDTVFVYRKRGLHWVEEARLVVNSQSQGSTGVRIDGGVIAVRSNPGLGLYYVSLFRFTGGAWVSEGALIFSEYVSDIDLENDTLVIGEPAAELVHVYRPTGSTWTLQQLITSPAGAADDAFGKRVALSGDALVASSDYPGCNGCPSYREGAAYTFRFDGATWNFEQQWCPTPDDNDDCAVASAEQIAINGDVAAFDSGYHYEIFRRSGGWSVAGISIGNALNCALAPGALVTGHVSGAGGRVSVARIFRDQGQFVWPLTDEFAMDTGPAGEYPFPARVATSANTLAVGFYGADILGDNSGLVRVYALDATHVNSAGGGTPAGTCIQPYSTFQDGAAAAPEGAPLVIAAGVYSTGAPLTLTRPMTLISNGGAVRISP